MNVYLISHLMTGYHESGITLTSIVLASLILPTFGTDLYPTCLLAQPFQAEGNQKLKTGRAALNFRAGIISFFALFPTLRLCLQASGFRNGKGSLHFPFRAIQETSTLGSFLSLVECRVLGSPLEGNHRIGL